jgi:two-component system LytT family sensor kinase
LSIPTIKNLFQFIQKYKMHVYIWFIFIFYETVLLNMISSMPAWPWGNFTVSYLLNIILFYVHSNLVLPASFENRKQAIWKAPLLILIEIMVFLGVAYVIVSGLVKYTSILESGPPGKFFPRTVYRTIYFTGISTGYYFLIRFLNERKLTEEMEKQRLITIIDKQKTQNELNITVNAYLKAQINPHFLFNTLNFIYNNARKSAPKAADAIMTLSEMMRYAIKSEDAGEHIYLSAEIEQVKNLIRLHQLRQNDNLYIEFNYDLDNEEIKFIPLVLMTLVENIFKHGNLSKSTQPATINIRNLKDYLEITTGNLINENQNSTGTKGIGLENIRKRLEHMYGDQVVFKYFTEDEFIFRVHIILKKANI